MYHSGMKTSPHIAPRRTENRSFGISDNALAEDIMDFLQGYIVLSGSSVQYAA